MKTLRTIPDVRRELAGAGRIGLVPTMGAFHEGHLALFRAAREDSETVVASLFVNPTQFAANEDLTRYPRDEARDAKLAEAAGIDILFAPSVEEMYPDGYATWVDVDETGAEGSARPAHFRGVATVCLKLFNIVRPQVAYFGQKDAQQAAVLRRMIRDLDIDLVLRVVPTVRDRGRPGPIVPERLSLGARTATRRWHCHGRSKPAVRRMPKVLTPLLRHAARSTGSFPSTSNYSTSTASRSSPLQRGSARRDLSTTSYWKET